MISFQWFISAWLEPILLKLCQLNELFSSNILHIFCMYILLIKPGVMNVFWHKTAIY